MFDLEITQQRYKKCITFKINHKITQNHNLCGELKLMLITKYVFLRKIFKFN